jgi:hypothetical protein
MTRVRLYLVGSLVLVALAGCGRSLFNFEQRAPWRHEAEVACMRSGAVKEGPATVRIEPIEGPGMCGADFPLKVAALATGNAIGFADELHPPGSIPNVRGSAMPRWPISQPVQPSAPPPFSVRDVAAAAPMAIHPAGEGPDEDAAAGEPEPDLQTPSVTPARPFYRPLPEAASPAQPLFQSERPPATVYNNAPRSYPPAASLPPAPLGPSRGQATGTIGPVALKPAATLACPIVSALDNWITTAVQPAAMRWFGQPVVAIRQISAYSCRGMNGNPRAHISEHAFGNALDIAAFTFADGRQVSVKKGWHGAPEEQGFLHDVQGAACNEFTTVLSPGYNIYHYDHIHVDLMRRSKGRHVCRPAAIPGEVAAARAAHGSKYAHRGDPAVTGSIRSARKPDHETADDDDFVEHDEPHESAD